MTRLMLRIAFLWGLLSMAGGCAGGGSAVELLASQDAAAPSQPTVTLAQAIADVQKLTPTADSGDGNDAALRELQDELIRVMSENSLDGKMVAAAQGSPRQIQLEFNLGVLEWYSELPGDYDQNGIVNAADLVPLSKSLGNRGPFAPAGLAFVLDGDGNAEINIGDVVPIARNYGSTITHWHIYRSSNAADYPEAGTGPNGPGAVLLRSDEYYGFSNTNKRYRNIYGPAFDHGSTYWVRAFNGEKEGPASTTYLAPDSIIGAGGWSMQGGNPQRSRLSPNQGPQSSMLRYHRDFGYGIAEVTFAADGTAYVQSRSEGNLQAVDKMGNTLWQNTSSRTGDTPPSVGADGSLYTAGGAAELIILEADGSERFRYDSGDINSQNSYSPLIGPDNHIHSQFSGGNVYSFRDNGEIDWTYELGKHWVGGPSCTPAGSLIISIGHSFIMLNQHRVMGFYHVFEDEVSEAPVIGPDRAVYRGSFTTGRFIALNSLLKPDWSVDNPGGSATVPAVAADGSLRFGTGQSDGSGLVHSYSAQGENIWSMPLAAPVHFPPVVDSDGTCFASTTAGEILAIDAGGNLLWSYETGTPNIYRLSISPEGYLYAAGWEGGLLVFGERIPLRDFTASDGTFQEEIHLQWTGLPDASGYEIEYTSADGNSPADWTQLAETAGADAIQYSHTQDEPVGREAVFGLAYEYRVRALYDAADPGPWTEPERGSMQENWTKWGHDLRNSQQALVNGPSSSHRLWSYRAVTFGHSCPVVASDGTVYIGSWDSFLYAINPDGSLQWKFQATDWISSTPAIDKEGTIYFGDYGGNFFAVNPDGSQKWMRHSLQTSASPVIGRNGRIYICEANAYLKSYDRDGFYDWEIPVKSNVIGSPCIGADDTIYIGGYDGTLTAVSPDGSIKWEYAGPGQMINQPCLATDGSIYANFGGKLQALNPAGEMLWQYGNVGDYSALAVGNDGDIRVLGYSGLLIRVNPLGTLVEQIQLPGNIYSDFSMDASGVIYYGTGDGSVYAMNPDGSELWHYKTGYEIYGTPTVSPNGRLYVGSGDGRLYAFGD